MSCSQELLSFSCSDYPIDWSRYQRLHLIVNLLCATAGPLPDTCPNGVQVKLLSVLSHQKHCVFYLETGAARGSVLTENCPHFWSGEMGRDSSGPLPEPRGALPRGWASVEVAKHQEGIPGSPCEWCLFLCTDSLTHGPAVSSAQPWALAAKLSSPAARFSDALGLGKGSWITAAVWRLRSPTYALFQKLPLTICPLRASSWDGSFCFRLLAFV